MIACGHAETKWKSDRRAGCRFVEVLSCRQGARPFGFRVGGVRPGPTVVVAGYAPDSAVIYDRLLDLPTLPWLRGTLVLMTLDALDHGDFDGDLMAQIGPVNRTLHLPFARRGDAVTAIREGYRTVLQLCAQLGMISGRGVNSRH